MAAQFVVVMITELTRDCTIVGALHLGCVMSDTCRSERKYSQDGGSRKTAEAVA